MVKLVNTFYSKVLKDDLLGPIFNKNILENQWPEHLDNLADFWETNLFGVAKFKGNPIKKHINVDKTENYTVESKYLTFDCGFVLKLMTNFLRVSLC